MNYPPPFSQAQLEIAVGGADKLLQLSHDPTGQLTGTVAQAFIAEVYRAVGGRLYSILGVAFDPADPTVQGSDFVQQLAVTMGIYWAWHKSTGGLAIPPDVKEANADSEKSLRETKANERNLGTVEEPVSQYNAHQAYGHRSGWTRKGWGGFC